MGYRSALAVFAVVLVLGGAAAAQPAASDLSGHWMMTITMTHGNSADQARLGQGADVYCGQSATLITCWSRDGYILLTGKRDGAAVQMSGMWESQGIDTTVHMTFDGRLVSPTLMEGHFDADIILGLGDYKASGDWKATNPNGIRSSAANARASRS